VVHRDVTPANVLCSLRGETKLVKGTRSMAVKTLGEDTAG